MAWLLLGNFCSAAHTLSPKTLTRSDKMCLEGRNELSRGVCMCQLRYSCKHSPQDKVDLVEWLRS